MWIVELILDIAGWLLELWTGIRIGFGSFWWEVAAGLCVLGAIFACVGELYLLAAIAGAGSIVCTVFSFRRFSRDLKKRRKNAQEIKQASPSPENGGQ